MRKRTKENILAGTFLTCVLGLLHLQEYQDTHSITENVKSNIMSSQASSTRYSKSQNVILHDYHVSEKDKIITEYTKIVTPEQEAEYMKQYENKQNEEENTETVDNSESDTKMIPIHPTNLGRMVLPPVYENIADLVDPVNIEDGEIPFFWHIARGGGSTIKDIMGGCLDITAASDVGTREGHELDETLNVIRINGGKYVNIDATSFEGIERAKKLNAIESGLVEVVVSPRLFAANTLFTPKHKGRMFTMFRDPIERAVSMFYYLGFAKWEKTYDPSLVLYELQDYAKTNQIENNWMVRSLTNKMEGYLTLQDLDMAKEILRRKCLIGLMKEKHVSMKRFELFFGWDEKAKKPGADECEDKLLSWGWPNKHRHPLLEPGTEAYRLLQTKNSLDIELYEYAKVLFVQQGLYFGLPTTMSLKLTQTENDKQQQPISTNGKDDDMFEE